jgi:peptidoglycan/LPS O-acetylase OafA/YrhL
MILIATYNRGLVEIMRTDDSNASIYFGGLNGLRFFAATAVIFHHVEQYKLWASRDLTHYTSVFGGDSVVSTFFEALGSKAVSLFFVLSGFLITYLLLAEHQKTETISLRKFYVRRILRIWPVYYLVILLTFFVMPHFFDIGHYGAEMLGKNPILWFSLCVFMLPNLVRFNSVELIGGNQTWSVGVEEQFYIMWPWLVLNFRKHFVRMLIVLIVVKTCIMALAAILAFQIETGIVHTLCNKVALYLGIFKIEQMAIGALGAWYLFNKKTAVLNFLYSNLLLIICGFLFLVIMFVDYSFLGDSLFEAFVFLVLILNVSTNPKFPLKFKHPYFNVLGNISYGIYMYHTLVIAVLMTVLQNYNLDKDANVFNVLLYGGSVIITVIISYLSYNYFEKWFLNKKEKFMVVKSSSNGKKTSFESVVPASVDPTTTLSQEVKLS